MPTNHIDVVITQEQVDAVGPPDYTYRAAYEEAGDLLVKLRG